jgi:hypothetical protein
MSERFTSDRRRRRTGAASGWTTADRRISHTTVQRRKRTPVGAIARHALCARNASLRSTSNGSGRSTRPALLAKSWKIEVHTGARVASKSRQVAWVAIGSRLAVACPQTHSPFLAAPSTRTGVLAAGIRVEPREEFIEPRASLGGQPGEVILAVRDLPIRGGFFAL